MSGYLTKLMANAAGAAVLASTIGCASAPQAAERGLVIPDPDKPAATACDKPTLKTAAVTIFAAGVGHVLDKKTGGGRGLERGMGQVADAASRSCTSAEAAPAPAPTR